MGQSILPPIFILWMSRIWHIAELGKPINYLRDDERMRYVLHHIISINFNQLSLWSNRSRLQDLFTLVLVSQRWYCNLLSFEDDISKCYFSDTSDFYPPTVGFRKHFKKTLGCNPVFSLLSTLETCLFPLSFLYRGL